MRHMFDPRLSVPMKEIVTVTLLVVWFCVVLQWCSVSFVGLGLRKWRGKTDHGEEKEGHNLNHTHMQIHINMTVRWHALDLPTLPSMWACFSLSLLHTPPPSSVTCLPARLVHKPPSSKVEQLLHLSVGFGHGAISPETACLWCPEPLQNNSSFVSPQVTQEPGGRDSEILRFWGPCLRMCTARGSILPPTPCWHRPFRLFREQWHEK